jgi:hypothetical protein
LIQMTYNSEKIPAKGAKSRPTNAAYGIFWGAKRPVCSQKSC